ncbi:DUF5011 domain-containing protein [Aggregatimonas sangjinii]|uniref:DUF5011 domain-containing protein n=1 Tax=Aggregatimonas sangjinii TaxID=2583587 RepID=A0A5B7SRY0_9FLAO|nr:immunoglobulin-like domain-containing protein [Aggregatimonas sangjinii]QCW99782.1 DUF5011 domain-containing protein [Aggregatimonas sangjinii]
MKKIGNFIFYLLVSLIVIIACTKEIGFVTEVEFDLVNQYQDEGFINQGLQTTFTILPEAEVEEASYSFIYKILQGQGYFENSGIRIAPEETMPFSSLTASLTFVGTRVGKHIIEFTVIDNYGFEKKSDLVYNVNDVPVQWVASSAYSQIQLNKEASIALSLSGSDINNNVTYTAYYTLNGFDGTFGPEEVGGFTLTDGYDAISIGSYRFTFVPNEIGSAVITFFLRDVNGQEVQTEVEFEVVQDISVSNIVVSQENPDANGAIRQLIATVLPENASDSSVNWISDNPTIASVDENGLLTGLTAGTVIITATSVSNPDVSGSIQITIAGISPEDGTDITAFALPDQISANIDYVSHTITVNVANGAALNVVPSIFNVSPGASTFPMAEQERNFNSTVQYTITAANGNQQVWTINSVVVESDLKSIDSFIINGVIGAISGTNIELTLPSGTDLTVLSPIIGYTGASINPNSGAAQDFSGPVQYTVTATDGSQLQYTVSVNVSASSEKSIDSFAINGVAGMFSGTNINLTLPSGTDLTTLLPIIGFTGISVSPNSGATQDFSGPVQYTVTAADGSQLQYTVSVNVLASSEKSIDSFTINGVAGMFSGTNINLTLPSGTDLTTLLPIIGFTGISVSPNSGATQDFSGPVQYTVTAADGSQLQYTVSVNVSASSEKSIDSFTINGVAGMFSGTNINLTLPSGTDLTTLSPIIGFTGISVSPNSGAAQNFTSQVLYTVTAEDASVIQYAVNVSLAPSSEKTIDNFAINGFDAFINGTVISLTLPSGTELTSLSPAIDYSGASISPETGVARNFSGPVDYIVTAEDNTQVIYTVNVTLSASSVKSIDDFIIDGVSGTISGTTITLTLPAGTDVTSLVPTIVYSGNLLTPASGIARNFTNEVNYTVEAEDGSQIEYSVEILVALDTTRPEISLIGPPVIIVDRGDTYNDEGATAFDNVDGDITANIVTVNNVNTDVAGNYTVTYDVVDNAGNSAVTVTREVTVEFVIVSCFVEGTKISMSDGSKKNIEDVDVGDRVLTYNTVTHRLEEGTVEELVTPIHLNFVELYFENGVMNTNTLDHPYYVNNKGWSSMAPQETKSKYGLEVKQLEEDDVVIFYDDIGLTETRLVKSILKSKEQKTYNLYRVSTNHNFFANGILVHNKYNGTPN